jgi:nucleoside transporter
VPPPVFTLGSPVTAGTPRRQYIRPRLMGMMFLQYFVLGAWVVTLAKYLGTPGAEGGLGFSPTGVAGIYSTFALGGLIAPLFTGLLADRYVAAERLLAGLQLVMAGLMFVCAKWCSWHEGPLADPDNAYWPLFGLMLIYSIANMSTLTLTNVLGFRNLVDPKSKFGQIRLVGTFGWVVAGLLLAVAFDVVSAQPLYLAAGSSVVMAGYALLLPHTPPKGFGRPLAEVVGLPALKLLRDPAFVVFAVVTFACNGLNQFYTVFSNPYVTDLGVPHPEAILTYAQWVEMGCMAVVPFLTHRLGLKTVMALGLVGWVLRNGLLWWGHVPLVVYVAIPMHGLSYAFFGMLGSIFVDREAPPHLRAGAQALVMVLTNGPALLIGNTVAGSLVATNTADGVTDWPAVWFASAVGYAAALVVFVLFFREPPERAAVP